MAVCLRQGMGMTITVFMFMIMVVVLTVVVVMVVIMLVCCGILMHMRVLECVPVRRCMKVHATVGVLMNGRIVMGVTCGNHMCAGVDPGHGFVVLCRLGAGGVKTYEKKPDADDGNKQARKKAEPRKKLFRQDVGRQKESDGTERIHTCRM